MKKKLREVTDYDTQDTSGIINRKKPLKLEDLGFKLPPVSPTQVISIRLPTSLLNEIRAKASARDMPYQALIKHLLAKSVNK
ncbi:MAG TPA: CopG family antitoxin [bacterium]|nr:CopG family antitoxin [bacterium]